MSDIILTPEQSRVFREFARYTVLYDEAPTVTELADRTGLETDVAADALAYLVGLGWIILQRESKHV